MLKFNYDVKNDVHAVPHANVRWAMQQIRLFFACSAMLWYSVVRTLCIGV